MELKIPDIALTRMGIQSDELLIEIAALLYDREALSMGQACTLSGVDRISFQKELAKRNIFIKYSVEDLEQDMLTLNTLRDEGDSE